MRILIIDDEPMVAAMLADALRDEGNDVLVSPSGQEGLAIVDQGWPEAVFLDIVMPGMDGTEVLRRIREREARLPVVIVSGWGSEEQIQAARVLGVSAVVRKPAALKHFTEALKRACDVSSQAIVEIGGSNTAASETW